MRTVWWLVALSTKDWQWPLSIGVSTATATFFTVGAWGALTWQTPFVVVAGLTFYTLAEYCFHRWVAHQWLYHHNVTDFHHALPENYFAAPWLLILPTAVLLWSLCTIVTGTYIATCFMASVAWSHLWQEFVHYTAHHTLAIWSLRRHHAIHHLTNDCNYGHSTTFWDHVFGTLRTK